MPFPTPLHGVHQGPGHSSHFPQNAGSMPIDMTVEAASRHGVKRKSSQTENLESPRNPSRIRPSPENELVGNIGKIQDANGTRDGRSFSSAITVQETSDNVLPSSSLGVGAKDFNGSYGQGPSHKSIDTKAVESHDETTKSEQLQLQLSEKERKLLLVTVANVEAMLEREKWNLVAQAMKLAGTPVYPGPSLESEYRSLAGKTVIDVKPSNAGPTAPIHRSMPNVIDTGYVESRSRLSPISHVNSNLAEGPGVIPSQTPASNHHGFGVLFNNGLFQHRAQQAPENVRARSAEQWNTFAKQGVHATRTTRPGAPSRKSQLKTANVPFSQPAMQAPLPNGKSAQNPSQHEAPRTEKPSPLKDASLPGIQYTSEGAPIFTDSPVASTPALESTAYVSPYTSVECPPEIPNATDAAGPEAPIPVATQVKTVSAFVPVNRSRAQTQDGQNPAPIATPSNTDITFTSVDGSCNEKTGDQSLDQQLLPVVTEPPVSVHPPSDTRASFVSVNGSRIERPRGQSQDRQAVRDVTELPTSVATPPSTATAFMPVNESSHEKQGKRVEYDAKIPPRIGSKIRLASDKVFILEREFQQDPKPTTEYKERLAKSLETTFFKVNNWYSNRRSKITAQANQLRVLQGARRNSSTVDPSPIESSRAVSTSITETTPDVEKYQQSSHTSQTSNTALPQVKMEPMKVAGTPDSAAEQSAPTTLPPQSGPIADRDQAQPNITPESHENRSSAMRAAWARRKAAGRNGRDGGAPKHSATARPFALGSSPIAFAAQILAAAEEAQESASPSPTPQDAYSILSSSPSQASLERSPAAISGISSSGDMTHNQLGKKRGAYRKRNVSGLATAHAYSPSSQLHFPSPSGPSSPTGYPTHGYLPSKSPEIPVANLASHTHACEKCGKSYQQFAGLKYHKEHHPNCETEPRKADKRTDPPDRKDTGKVNGARIAGVEAWAAVNSAF